MFGRDLMMRAFLFNSEHRRDDEDDHPRSECMHVNYGDNHSWFISVCSACVSSYSFVRSYLKIHVIDSCRFTGHLKLIELRLLMHVA